MIVVVCTLRSVSHTGMAAWYKGGIPTPLLISLSRSLCEFDENAPLPQTLDSFVHDGKESLAKYKARLLELKTDLGNSTTSEIISDERALYVYTSTKP